MPRREGGGSDLSRRIQAVFGSLLALSLLLWLERGRGDGDTVFLNNFVALGSAPSRCCCEEEALLAGRGGEEEGQIGAARCPDASLLAGLGGEEELRRGALMFEVEECLAAISLGLSWC
jgi:hypothetical protein